MKKLLLTLAIMIGIISITHARNKITRVKQVSTKVTVSEDVDYTITSTTPFTTDGIVNITNTEHAVLIFQKIRPTKALNYLSHVEINGVKAVNGENCQVKMYGQGAIVMPYEKNFKPLTVYTEQNFEGESTSEFGLEHSGGYMNTLTAAKFNNRIRSFKLKRGYMVTFAIGTGGRGYSRCFIADYADLEIATLPTVLDSRISSYRIFKWNDAEKKGIANDTGTEIIQALNASWCYSFGPGEDKGIDCECVPHKIEIGWPGNCGTLTYSPHLKTNNEPGNSADHGVEDLDAVLATWEDLMRTGKRLCSPSSHDGSLNWLRNFMDSIDARGWRCDILDLHCYWPQWNLMNQVQGWYDSYKRPIWISEFVWGASWNNNGIFAEAPDGWDSYSERNQQKNYDGMKPVFDNWNNAPYIERYAYWNSERDCSKIYRYGSGISKLGTYFAEMNSNIGYNRAYEFVPRVVYKAPKGFNLTYTESKKKLELTWENPHGELTDSTLLEIKFNNGEWETLEKYESSEKTSYSYSTTVDETFESGVYTYRVRNFDSDGKIRITGEKVLSMIGASGTPGFQYGTMEISSADEISTSFTPVPGEESVVFTGLITYKNKNTVPVNSVFSVDTTGCKFIYKAFPWNAGSYEQTFTEKEETDFMVLTMGEHQIGDIRMYVGKTDTRISDESVWVDFPTPFEEGVTPIVMANIIARFTRYPLMVKIHDVTNKGFYVKLARQEGSYASVATTQKQYVYYVAATPGSAKMSDGKLLNVGTNKEEKVDGVRYRGVTLLNQAGEELELSNPVMLCGPQTNNYDVASVYRLHGLRNRNVEVNEEELSLTYTLNIIRQKDNTSTSTIKDLRDNNGDCMGWIIVSDDVFGGSNIATVKKLPTIKVRIIDGNIYVENTDSFSVYTISGQRVSSQSLSRGIYIVKANGQSVKVFVP